MYYYYVAVYSVSFLFFIIELFFHRAARSKTILIITSSIYCIINRHQTYTVLRLCCPELSYIYITALQTTFDCYNIIIVNLYINVRGFLCTRERDCYNYFNFFLLSPKTKHVVGWQRSILYTYYLHSTGGIPHTLIDIISVQ